MHTLVDSNLAPTSAAAWASFEPLIRSLVSSHSPRVVMEIGGGRNPLISAADARDAGVERYIVNDVSADELAHLPNGTESACFDVQDGAPAAADYGGRCDLLFANMVFEHLSDPAGAWRSVHDLLRPGGIAVSFHPVLYSPPFLANRLLPERLSRRVLRRFFPSRHDGEHPKFPAYYRWCRASQRYMSERLLPIGFATVSVRPFFGHQYFDRIPLVRSIDRRLTVIAQRRDWRSLASYAYVVVVK